MVLTFDYATASQFSLVAPLLKKFGFGGTFYVCEFPPNFRDSSKYMNWRQIRELDKMGFEVANHTRTHPHITGLSEMKFKEQIDYIDHQCDSLHITKPNTFAYPGYDLNLPVMDLLQKKGFTSARAGGSRPYDPLVDHPLLLPSWAMNGSNKSLIMEAFQEARGGKIVILTIHGVPDAEHPWVTTPPELFREYLEYLSENKYHVLSVRELTDYIDFEEAAKTIVPDFNKKLKN